MSNPKPDLQIDFLNALAELGVVPAKAIGFLTDGRIHRYRVEGDRSGSKNGWYVLYDDGDLSAGAFGSWKTGVSGTWCSKSERTMTPQEREAVRKKMEDAKAARQLELQQVRKEASEEAERLWSAATPARCAGVESASMTSAPEGVHPYVWAKQIRPYGVRRLKTMLLVPVRDVESRLMTLQRIFPDGSKRFLPGGMVAGGYYAIGRPENTLCICEGFATGASIREATGFAVAVAFNDGNLLPVAKVLRDKFPALNIVICADNDQATEGNPGVNKAEGAAGQAGGRVAIPVFDPNESIDGKTPTDFNDLHRLRGLDAVRTVIQDAIGKAPPVKAALTRKEMEQLIDETDDFDVLTMDLVMQVAQAGFAVPAKQFLMAKIAKKAGVPKASLFEYAAEESGGNWNKAPPESGDESNIGRLNEKHAVLPVGGRVLIMNREWDPVQEKQLMTFSSKTDFETRYCNRKVFDRGEETGLGTYWLNHPKRAEYDGMVFSPGSDVEGYLNLWTGWGIEPRYGDCMRYLEFIGDVICSGDGELFDYIIRWLAHMVQRPEELPETALVFRGREGIGKNTLVDPLRDIVGREHFLLLSSLNQITGRFSGHLANALLVFCNESVWGGDKSAQGVLKSMITDEVQPIEHKGRDLTMVRSYRRMLFATNENWAVPRGADDRRYIITDVSDSKKGDYPYFKAIREQMDAGGTAALMHHLLNEDISDWHPRQIPGHLSVNGWELKIRSGGSIVQWWFDILQRGWTEKVDADYGGEDSLIWLDRCPTERLQSLYVRWCVDYKIAHPEHSVVLGKAIRDWGISTSRPRHENPNRKLFYKIPPLDQAREIFSDRFSIPTTVWDEHEEGSIYA